MIETTYSPPAGDEPQPSLVYVPGGTICPGWRNTGIAAWRPHMPAVPLKEKWAAGMQAENIGASRTIPNILSPH